MDSEPQTQGLRSRAYSLAEKMFDALKESLKGAKTRNIAVRLRHYENAEEFIFDIEFLLSDEQRLYYEGAYKTCASAEDTEECVNELKTDFRQRNCEAESFKFVGPRVKAYTATVEGEHGAEYYYCFPILNVQLSRILYPYMIDDLLSDEARIREFVQNNVVEPAMRILDLYKQMRSIA